MKTYLFDEEKRTLVFLALSAVALAVSFFDIGSLPIDAAWLAIILCGIPIIKGAIVGLVTEFDVKADVLVALALVASVAIGEIFAAGEVAFIMAIGAYLEERTVKKARAGIEKLVHLTPTTARVVRDGVEAIIPAQDVQTGDILRVNAGERIAVDGVITKGQTSIDQSIMTGESLPVDKQDGDDVFSGTVNQFGAFDMRATKVGEDSSLQRMIRLVESADASKAKIVGLADRWATWVVVIALASAVITWLVTGEVIRSVTILVVFCPCALVLATPTAIMAGIGNASRYGILVREGDALERLAKVTKVVFDKTGTLTYGYPTVAAVESCVQEYSADSMLAVAAMAESRSEHPLGKAIVAHYREKTEALPDEPEHFTMLAGRGVVAERSGERIVAGNQALLRDNAVELPFVLTQAAERRTADGATVVYVARNGVAIGMIALADALRSDAALTVAAVRRLGTGTMMLTGDATPAARHVAALAGIDEYKADCLPEDKMAIIQSSQTTGIPVCMVGDGVNDAAALKSAQVGIAMAGIGSDIAVEAADIALVGDNIREIPHLLGLAKKTMRTIIINLSASMILNFVAIGFAISGLLNPVLGALVHNAGSVAVIVNSALLLKWRGQEMK